MLDLAARVDDFVAAPRGRYVCGQSFVYGCFEDDLFATCLWGDPSDEIATLVQAFEAEVRLSGTHVSLFDGSMIDNVDRSPYVPLTEFVQRRRDPLVARVRQVALVRPRGLVGMIMAGFRDVLDPIPSQLFADRNEALMWLGRSDAPALAAEMDVLIAQAEGRSAIRNKVRALLANDVATWTGPAVARHLGVSERSLQRRLKEAGTTFGAEYRAAQIRTAERLLRNATTSLTAIAMEIGCSSQQFSTLFRRVNGVSPSEWRASQIGPQLGPKR